MSKEIFAYNLDRIMKERDIKNTELSKSLKYDQSSVATWRRGVHEPRQQVKVDIARILDVPYSEFEKVPPQIEKEQEDLAKQENETMLDELDRAYAALGEVMDNIIQAFECIDKERNNIKMIRTALEEKRK